jgi:glycolate oxidase FAD binding subunit
MITEDSIAAAVTGAAAAKEPIWVQGNGTKSAMLRQVQAARTVSTADLSGIVLYAPKELIISAKAGTPLPEIQAALAASGQHIIAEPPDLSELLGSTGKPQTIGGIVATNLSGPRRVVWGAMRDHVMGVRAVTGRGEIIRSGGRVLKNVTGLDLCKLLTGSHGTLGIVTEVTLKVLPAPEATGTLVIEGHDAKTGVAALSAALGSPFGVSAAAWLPPESVARVSGLADVKGSATLIRVEDFAPSVTYRIGRIRNQLGGGLVLETAESLPVWRDVGNAKPLAAAPSDAVWRVSVRPSAGPGVLAALADHGVTGYLDGGGGWVWLAGPATAETHEAVEQAALASKGTWMLLRAPDALRTAVRVVPDDPAPLARIAREVKAAMDPAGILNPGRLYGRM